MSAFDIDGIATTSASVAPVYSPPGWENSTLIDRRDLTDMLAVFRLQPDADLFRFRAGQYTVIGLPAGAPRHHSAEPEEEPIQNPAKLIRRAYSIASSSKVNEYVELYITLVLSGALTPRLWPLRPGDHLWLGSQAKGHFTLDAVPPDRNVVLVGTGTGLAPYMSMIRDHHRCNLGRRFIVIHGARRVRELGYRDELTALARECSTLEYVPTVSRPAPQDRWAGHVGRVQSVLANGALESALGEPLSPATTHVFVAGNPEMVEDTQRMLVDKRFTLHSPREPGALHVERYW